MTNEGGAKTGGGAITTGGIGGGVGIGSRAGGASSKKSGGIIGLLTDGAFSTDGGGLNTGGANTGISSWMGCGALNTGMTGGTRKGSDGISENGVFGSSIKKSGSRLVGLLTGSTTVGRGRVSSNFRGAGSGLKAAGVANGLSIGTAGIGLLGVGGAYGDFGTRTPSPLSVGTLVEWRGR